MGLPLRFPPITTGLIFPLREMWPHTVTLSPPRSSACLFHSLTLSTKCHWQNLDSSLNIMFLHMFSHQHICVETSANGTESEGHSWQPCGTGDWLCAVSSGLSGQRAVGDIVLSELDCKSAEDCLVLLNASILHYI